MYSFHLPHKISYPTSLLQPHLFCKSSCPNYVVVGMQVVHLDLVAVSSRTDRMVMLKGTSQSDKYVASDEIIPGTPANSRYAAMM